MSNKGWIKTHRSLLHSDIFQNDKLFKIFMWCTLKASHTEHEQVVGRQKVTLLPGQFVFGRSKASLELGYSQSTVWDYMNLLKSKGTISIKSNNKFSVITIENWRIYQGINDISDNKTDNKQTTNRQQKDTNKNVKNDKKKEIYSRVITRLNESVNKNFKSTTKKTIDCINTRLNEGFEEEDFYKVIEIKCQEWLNTDNDKYLRPETLFGNKFEGYLNQRPKYKQQSIEKPKAQFGKTKIDYSTMTPEEIIKLGMGK